MKVMTNQEIVDAINSNNKRKFFIQPGRVVTDADLMRIARKSSYTNLVAFKNIITVEKDRRLLKNA